MKTYAKRAFLTKSAKNRTFSSVTFDLMHTIYILMPYLAFTQNLFQFETKLDYICMCLRLNLRFWFQGLTKEKAYLAATTFDISHLYALN